MHYFEKRLSKSVSEKRLLIRFAVYTLSTPPVCRRNKIGRADRSKVIHHAFNYSLLRCGDVRPGAYGRRYCVGKSVYVYSRSWCICVRPVPANNYSSVGKARKRRSTVHIFYCHEMCHSEFESFPWLNRFETITLFTMRLKVRQRILEIAARKSE